MMDIPKYISDFGIVCEPRAVRLGHDSLISQLINLSRIHKNDFRRLKPRHSSQNSFSSLSDIHGFDCFPKHTDFAMRGIPPRIIALHCPSLRPSKTILYDTRNIELEISDAVRDALFRVTGSRRPFSSLFSTARGYNRIYRFNLDCMTPLNEAGVIVSDFIRSHARATHRICWDTTRTIAFDNWRFLHSRESVDPSRQPGWLWRLAIWSEA